MAMAIITEHFSISSCALFFSAGWSLTYMTLQKRMDSNKLERWGVMRVPSAMGMVVKFSLTYFTNQTSTTYKSIFSSLEWLSFL